MGILGNQDTGDKPSLIEQDTLSKTREAHEQGRYYNANYAIENFISAYEDANVGDPFKALDDPTYTGFKLFFHYDNPTGLLADEQNTNSALAYLLRIGHIHRYELLKRFITTLSKVNSITPWVFQDIEGLQEVFNEPFGEVYKKKQVTINCLETIDLKMTSLAMMYRNIVFDEERQSYVLPLNLRRFSMSIYVFDFRTFSDLSETSTNFLQTLQNQDVRNLNHVMFDLGYCEFDITSGSAFLNTVSNNNSEAASSNMTINFYKHALSGLFKTITGNSTLSAEAFSVTQVGTSGAPDPTLGQALKQVFVDAAREQIGKVKDKVADLLDVESWKKSLIQLGTETALSVVDQVRNRLTGLYLGNVYGFGLSDLAQIGPNLQQINQQARSTESTTRTLNTPSQFVSNIGNVND